MRRIRSLVALGLLVIWLPAALHCELEWVGAFGECGACHQENDGTVQDTDADGCALTDSDAYRLPNTIVVPKTAPLAFAFAIAIITPPAVAVSAGPPRAWTSAPLHVIRRWQFIVRAAPHPRAPGSVR